MKRAAARQARRRGAPTARALGLAALALLAFVALVAFASLETDGGSRVLAASLAVRAWLVDREMGIKLALSLVCAALVLWPESRRGGPPARQAPGRFKAAAALALASHYNFGAFHGRGSLHYAEMFHYHLGSKYFPELGYDGLYEASIGAQRLTTRYPVQPYIRDLRDNEIVPVGSLGPRILEVPRRFSSPRFREFVRDHEVLLRIVSYPHIRLDHGYNPSPTWTFVARLFGGWGATTRTRLIGLAAIDQVLLVAMWWLLFRTYGSRSASLAMVVFGLSHPSRFYWIGGAFLRFDWLVAAVAATCLLKGGRPFAAGTLFAYAAMVRVFPVFFLFGPAVVALRCLVRREDLRWARRLAAGFAVSALLCFAAGSAAGRGVAAWGEFGRNLGKHHGSWLTNNVGLKNLVAYGPETYGHRLVDRTLYEPWKPWQDSMRRWDAEVRPAFVLAAAAFLALLAAAAWRSSPDEAAILGPAVAFTLVLLTCYYWSMLLLVPLRGGRWAAGALLLLDAGLFGLQLATGYFEVIFGVASWALALLLVAWLLPGVARRGRGSSPAAPLRGARPGPAGAGPDPPWRRDPPDPRGEPSVSPRGPVTLQNPYNRLAAPSPLVFGTALAWSRGRPRRRRAGLDAATKGDLMRDLLQTKLPSRQGVLAPLPRLAVALAASLTLAPATLLAGTAALRAALANPVLQAGARQTTYLKVALAGRERSVDRRPPVNIAFVIDQSGSMAGEKIERAREAAVTALRMLEGDDIVSVIAYDSTVSVLLPATRLGEDREEVIAAVRRLQPRRNTALHAGVSKGAAELRKFLSRGRVNRIVLLSDGLANVGPASPSQLGALGASLAKEGISVTTFGLGLDYNEDLMTRLALLSGGNHLFVEEATDLARSFRAELGDVLAVVAEDVTVRVECARGVRPVRVLGRPADVSDRVVVSSLRQLSSAQEKYLLLELEVEPGRAGQVRDLAAVRASYLDLATGRPELVSGTVSARFSASPREVSAAIDQDVMVAAVMQIANERNKLATDLRDRGRLKDARSALEDNAAYLAEMARRYDSDLLESTGLFNLNQAQGLDPESWKKTRKQMREGQAITESQQNLKDRR